MQQLNWSNTIQFVASPSIFVDGGIPMLYAR